MGEAGRECVASSSAVYCDVTVPLYKAKAKATLMMSCQRRGADLVARASGGVSQAGGNSIAFAKFCGFVVSCELDAARIESAKANAAVYGKSGCSTAARLPFGSVVPGVAPFPSVNVVTSHAYLRASVLAMHFCLLPTSEFGAVSQNSHRQPLNK